MLYWSDWYLLYLRCLRFIFYMTISRLSIMAFHAIPIHYHGGLSRLPIASIRCIASISFPIAAWTLFSPGHTVDNAQWPALHMPQLVQLSWRASGGQRQPYIQHSPRRIELHGTFGKGWHVMTCSYIFQLTKYDVCRWSSWFAAVRFVPLAACSRDSSRTCAASSVVSSIRTTFTQWLERERERERASIWIQKACVRERNLLSILQLTCFEQIWNDMRQNMAEFT